MIKTLKNLFKQDKERFLIPNGVQDVIPIRKIYDDGVFQVGDDKFSKTYKFTDINYAVASREDKETMFLEYSELLNSFDSGATTKITNAKKFCLRSRRWTQPHSSYCFRKVQLFRQGL